MLGLDDKNYPRFNNFRERVLLTAQKEIKNKTDLEFDYETIKKGRKIGAINFIIRHNANFEAVEEEGALDSQVLPESYDEAVAAMLSSAVPELPDDVVTLLASRLDAVSVSQAFLSYSNAKKAGKIKDPAAYFLGILKHQEQPAKEQEDRDPNDTSWADGVDFDEF